MGGRYKLGRFEHDNLVSEPRHGGEESGRLGKRLEWSGLFCFDFCIVFCGAAVHNSAVSSGIVFAASV